VEGSVVVENNVLWGERGLKTRCRPEKTDGVHIRLGFIVGVGADIVNLAQGAEKRKKRGMDRKRGEKCLRKDGRKVDEKGKKKKRNPRGW